MEMTASGWLADEIERQRKGVDNFATGTTVRTAVFMTAEQWQAIATRLRSLEKQGV